MILYPKKINKIGLLVTASFFFLTGVGLAIRGELIGYLTAFVCIWAVLIAVINLLPGSTYLKIEDSGLTFCTLFKKRSVSWSDVEVFFPIKIGGNGMVGFNFVASYASSRKSRNFSKEMAGCEAALPYTYGKKAVELADLLNGCLAKSRQVTGGIIEENSEFIPQKISREGIAGAKIVDIYCLDESTDDMSISTFYFLVDHGFCFCLPVPGYQWMTSEIPANAEIVPDEYIEESFSVKNKWFRKELVAESVERVDLVKRLKEKVIAGVFYPEMDEELGFYEPDEACLVFEDGSYVYCLNVAPQGIQTGIFYNDICPEDDRKINFFDVPLADDE